MKTALTIKGCQLWLYAMVFGFLFLFCSLPSTAKQTKKVKSAKAANDKAKISAWRLEQTSNLVGPLKCVVSKNGVRLNAEKLGLLWIFKAPEWDAYLYNLETKNYCSFKYEVWKKRGFFLSGRRHGRGRHRAGQSLKKMIVKNTGKKMTIANMKVEQVEFTTNAGAKYGEFWITKEIVVPEQFKEVVANMLRLPIQAGGTPLKAVFRNRHQALVPVLETKSAKPIKVKPDLFNPLKGYGRVKDEMALLFVGSEVFGSTDTMFGDGSSKKKKNRHNK